MPRNIGEQPETGEERIDIQFRNGQTKRGVLAKQYRWKPWEMGRSDWDIVRWQYADQQPQSKDVAA